MIAPVRRAFTAKALVPRLNCRLGAGRTAQPLPLLAIHEQLLLLWCDAGINNNKNNKNTTTIIIIKLI